MPRMNVEQLKEQLGQRAMAVARLLRTPDGQALLEALQRAFVWGEPGKDDRGLYAWLGGREVVLYLQELQRTGERVENDGRR